jgi:DNA-directed RNA polymerase subunit RPC12/RpoP
MPQTASGPPLMEAECPYCERRVLAYEVPPRCPLCACPLEDKRLRPFAMPGEGEDPAV